MHMESETPSKPQIQKVGNRYWIYEDNGTAYGPFWFHWTASFFRWVIL